MSTFDFDKRELIRNPTNEQLEKQLICRLLSRTSCPVEEQKLEAIRFWITDYPRLTWSSSLSEFLDALVAKVDSYEPEIIFDTVGLYLNQGSLSVWSRRKVWQSSEYTSELTSASFESFVSDTLVVLTKIDQENNQGYFSNVTISSTYNSKVISLSLDKSSVKEYLTKIE